MKARFAELCEAANISSDGRLNVLGLFDTIRGQAVPIPYQRMLLILKLEVEKAVENVDLRVKIVDNLGQNVGPDAKAELKIPVSPDRPDSITANAFFELRNLSFPLFGDYRVAVTANGAEISSSPLHVIPAPPSPRQA